MTLTLWPWAERVLGVDGQVVGVLQDKTLDL